jgi:2-polyprenyl-6-methoxyphenol hydroxylase-like FAD-dependent oxidoreductase
MALVTKGWYNMQSSTNEQRNATQTQQEIKHVAQTTCCIVGSGPAGAVLALLLARQGIPVMLLEAHMDFDRDFRGDTIHPSVLTILDELGLADRLLQIRHTEMHTISMQRPNDTVTIGDFSLLKTKYPYVAVIPQADFLKFITDEAGRYPSFQLVMGAQVDDLLVEDGCIHGVRYRGMDGYCEVRAVLTVGTDGRFSRLRKLAGFEPIKTSPPMDILWFRLSRKPSDPDLPLGRFAEGHILVTLNRYDYWQVGSVIPKGKYQEVRAAGLQQFRQFVAETIPLFADRVDALQEWKQISVLSVESSRIPRWYRPGLLLIGDAAHVMSPVGGVGINYAVQDAVVAANVLAGKLKYGIVQLRDLAKVQRQREVPTRVVQAFQNLMQQQVLASVLNTQLPPSFSPLVHFLLRIPLVRYIPTRLIALGIKQVHVRP